MLRALPAAPLVEPLLLRASVLALALATAVEAALVALVAAHREDAWTLPMLLALLWGAVLRLNAHSAAATAAATAATAAAPEPLRAKAD
jgi:hypothetical protein